MRAAVTPAPAGQRRHAGEWLGFHDGRAVNHTEAGRRLRRLCRDMLARFVPATGCGFQDGGCVTLATALVGWSEGAIQTWGLFAAGHRTVSHVIGRHGDAYMDSDGIGTAEDMLAKFGIENPRFTWRLAPYRPALIGGNDFFPEQVAWIEGRLRRRLGPFDPASMPSLATARDTMRTTHPNETRAGPAR